ncbi:hypothetical protein GCM10027091_21380 [Streptomyces daliensis]
MNRPPGRSRTAARSAAAPRQAPRSPSQGPPKGSRKGPHPLNAPSCGVNPCSALHKWECDAQHSPGA